MKLVAAVVMMMAVTGGGMARAEAPRSEVAQAEAEAFLAFFNKFVDAVIANKDQCPKMASEVNAVIDANQEILLKAQAAKKDKKKLPKAIEDKMMQRVKEMVPAMQKCGNDKDVSAAVKRLSEPKAR